MKKYDSLWIGLICGVLAPVIVFILYFSIRDPGLHLADQVNRMIEADVLAYYVSLCAISNLLLFFAFLQLNRERSARGVLGSTILYAFTVVILKIT